MSMGCGVKGSGRGLGRSLCQVIRVQYYNVCQLSAQPWVCHRPRY